MGHSSLDGRLSAPSSTGPGLCSGPVALSPLLPDATPALGFYHRILRSLFGLG